jgi:hypothetical protein
VTRPRRHWSLPMLGGALWMLAASAGVAILVTVTTATGLDADLELAQPQAAVPDGAVIESEPQVAGIAATPTPLPVPRYEPPPVPGLYAPSDNESERDAKRLGAAIAHRLTNYEIDTPVSDLAAAVAPDPIERESLIETMAPLHHSGRWSRGTIEYAQLGGLRNDKTSIMVVVRQEVGVGGDMERSETRTIDIRLRRGADTWVFDGLAHAGGDPVARPADLSPEAASVVDDPRISLPDSALWDIYRGHTSVTLLKTMAALADQTPYAAVVLSNGHPYYVFETDRVSRHTVGRAIDVYLLGDSRVIDTRSDGSATNALVQWLLERPEVTEVGSPWALGQGSFTNTVHQDHIHIGVS